MQRHEEGGACGPTQMHEEGGGRSLRASDEEGGASGRRSLRAGGRGRARDAEGAEESRSRRGRRTRGGVAAAASSRCARSPFFSRSLSPQMAKSMNGRSISLLGQRFPAHLLCFLPAPIYFPRALVYGVRHIVIGRLPDAYRRLGDALQTMPMIITKHSRLLASWGMNKGKII